MFGSYAHGNYDKWSDIDIALISNIFEGNRIKDRDKIRKYYLSVSSSLEVITFNPDDFNDGNPFAKEILGAGIKIV